MKASLKFREDQKPLFRAKVPLSILGFPFQSGISTGDSKELCLNLSTFFEPGPSLKLAYHPNDSWNSFSLVVKTGIKHFGSPICSPITMSAEFNLNSGGNPRFFLQFKPHIGDFAIKKTAGSSISFQPQSSDFDPKIESNAKDHDSDTGGSVDGGQTPLQNGAYRSEKDIFSGEKIDRFSTETHAAGAIGNLFSGMEVNATTIVPVRNVAVLKFRWGIKSPPEIKSAFIRNRTAQISLRKVPVLVMDKIAIEHVADNTKRNPAGPFPGRNADMAEACFTINRQLETMQAENGLLRKAVEELRSENAGEKPVTFAGTQDWETERSGGKALGGGNGGRNSSETSGIAGKMTGCAVNEELKKAH